MHVKIFPIFVCVVTMCDVCQLSAHDRSSRVADTAPARTLYFVLLQIEQEAAGDMKVETQILPFLTSLGHCSEIFPVAGFHGHRH